MAAKEDHDLAVSRLDELLERRRIPQAREVLAQALQRFPDSADLLQQAAWLEWLEDNVEEALSLANRVLQIQPGSANARSLRARIYVNRSKLPEAEEELISLLRDYPEEPSFYALYATVMLESFHFEKAEALANEALRRDPTHEEALNVHALSGLIGSSGDEQRERLRKLLREYPDQVNTSLRMIQHLANEGNTRDAYRLTRELVQLYPHDEDLVELATELKRATHWSLLPLWPMQKWGWAGAIGIWFGAMLLIRSDLLASTPLAGSEGTIALVFIGWVVYSWVWPPILRRLIR